MALGAAVGLTVPETRQEHRIMGEARDTVMDRAQEAMESTIGSAADQAEEVIHSAEQVAEQVQEDPKEGSRQ